MSPATSTLNDELLPLFVGITGHRDLREEDIQPLRGTVQKVLRDLKVRYPNTPLIALSPLSEGADRLVARTALDEGMDLIVPLPLPRAIYESSFSNDESRAEFAQLLERARAVFTLPWIECGHESENGLIVNDEPTEAQIEGQYAAMGAYLARYSHVLLALWDGDDLLENERTGGTAQIVRFRLHGAPPPYGPVISPLERAGYGAVHHILTPRQSRVLPDKTTRDSFSLEVVLSDNAVEDFGRVDIFNAEVKKHQSDLGAVAHENARTLITGNTPQPDIPSPTIPSSLQLPLSIYGWSDTLSTFFSRQLMRSTRRVFGLVFLAALSFNLFHSLPHGTHGEGHATSPKTHTTGAVSPHAPKTPPSTAAHGNAAAAHGNPSAAHGSSASPAHGTPVHANEAGATNAHTPPATEQLEAPATTHGEAATTTATPFSIASLWSLLPWFLWIYLLMVGLNIALHGRAEKQELQNKYQDYRALAEGLRVQIFWRMAGLHEDVSDHYLGKQRGELNWIRHAIKSCNVLADAHNHNNARNSRENLPLVVRQWAREQRNYYVGKAHREHKELEKQEGIIRRLVIASVILSLILGLILSLPALLPLPFLEPLKAAVEVPLTHAVIMIIIVMLAVIAGLLHGYNTLLARAEHTKRYGRMGTLFEDATNQLEAHLAAGHTHKTGVLLHELGREALAENGDWVLLHRERPLEVPHAG